VGSVRRRGNRAAGSAGAVIRPCLDRVPGQSPLLRRPHRPHQQPQVHPAAVLALLRPGQRLLGGGIRVEELDEGDVHVVRAELPGIDSDKDVDISIHDGLLHISGERTEKHEGSFRSEFRYGRFERALPLPAGVAAEDVAATYDDGVLEVRIPVPATAHETAKVPIRRR
jgi:HSP20 family protein